MTSIDNLLRAHAGTSTAATYLPTSRNPSQNKRKYPGPPTPGDVAEITRKIPKLSANGSPYHQNTAVEGETSDTNDENIAAGPSQPSPDGVEEGGQEEDEEGRFFGGGIDAGARDALDYIDGAEVDGGIPEEEVIDETWLRRMAVGFEKKINKNAEMRGRYEGEPEKFVTSEADLDAEIKALSILSEHPQFYPEFAKLGSAGSLVGLLAHENTDIAIDAIEVLRELTDDDVGAEESHWRALVDTMLKADLVDLLVQNLARFDEDLDSDGAGVYHILGMVENLCSQQAVAENIAVEEKGLLKWLLDRIQREEGQVSQNKQYAAEIMAILLQSSGKTRSKFADMEGVDALLNLVSAYRRRDPERDSNEEEYVENLFDCLICMVGDAAGKNKFLEAEGVELCLIMLREGKMSKSRALRALDHTLSGSTAMPMCERFVDAAGLKTIFALFMKKHEKEAAEHVLGIFSSLLRLLPANSPARIRTLAKFVERDYEKIARLAELRQGYCAKVSMVDSAIKAESQALNPEDRAEMTAGPWLSRRLDAGLFAVQTIDLILSWLIAEDEGAGRRVEALLASMGAGPEDLRRSLQDRLQGVHTDQPGDDAEIKDVLETLLQCL